MVNWIYINKKLILYFYYINFHNKRNIKYELFTIDIIQTLVINILIVNKFKCIIIIIIFFLFLLL